MPVDHRSALSGLRSRFRRSVAVPVSCAVALTLATGGWYAWGSGDGREATRAAAGSLAGITELPWPAEGQAAAEVEGVGSLGSKGGQTPVPIASLTKVMTAYVVLTARPLRPDAPGATVVADQRAADESFSTTESTAPVVAGREYTQRQLLELMLVPSGNNVARLLARWDAGDEQQFVRKMNQAARQLGMGRTTYTGVAGMEASTRSTAADQLKLARAVMRDAAFRQIVALPAITAPDSGSRILNTNTLLGQDGVIGLKTGSSTPAGGNLMWAATQQVAGADRLILGVVLHQHADTNPTAAKAAALEASRVLITAIRTDLPRILAAPPFGRDGDPKES
ncbi:D-alanyl-D-alanine carboxypeptidase family protein [Streptomyces sp. IBSNAI002]|uniref:D-alanyl-D-alanine carboxypeptidase family protein n=1 Tax=Streptomyces sp. IBSNAI002 TaxID=3457500 RepID=UPI003FCFAD00